jgi:hypothetical protein
LKCCVLVEIWLASLGVGIFLFLFLAIMLLFALWSLGMLGAARASVTVYGQVPIGISSALAPTGTVAAAYNDTTLQPPAVPSPAPPTAFTLSLQAANKTVSGLSIPIHGTFFGFSVEMSVITQLCSSLLLNDDPR